MEVSAQKEPPLHLRPGPLNVITTLTFITRDFFSLLKTAQMSWYRIYGYSKSMIKNALFLFTSTKQNPSYFLVHLPMSSWVVCPQFYKFESANAPPVFAHYSGAREVDCYWILAAENDAVASICKQVIWGLHICVLFCCVYTHGGSTGSWRRNMFSFIRPH